MTSEDSTDKREERRFRWPPVISATLAVGIGGYAAFNGLTALSEFFVLLLIGSTAVLVAYGLSLLRRLSDNAVLRALHGTVTMLAAVTGLAIFGLALKRELETHPDAISTLIGSNTAQEAFANVGPALNLLAPAFIVFLLTFMIAISVYADMLGGKRADGASDR